MQHFIYPEKQYMHINRHGRFTVDYDDKHGEFKFTTVADGVRVESRLTVERAAMIAGFLLSKHPAIVKGDAMAFSLATRACDAIHEPDFTVITPGHELLAKPAVQDTKDDDQDVEIHRPPAAADAPTGASAVMSRTWVAQDDDQDIGDLHPDQERRLTALSEASKLLAGRLNHDRLTEWADWILNGDTPTN